MSILSSLYYFQEMHIWIIFLISFPILFLISPSVLRRLNLIEKKETLFNFAIVVSSFLLFLCLIQPFQYLIVDRFLDHAEAQIPSVAWALMRGESIYHALNSNSLYSLFYGPYLYLIQGVFLKVFGGSFFVAKLPGVLAFFISLGFIYFSARRVENKKYSFLILCAAAAVLSQFGGFNYWVRSDPLILICLSIGTFFSLGRSRLSTVLGIGISFGVAVNLKVTAFAYFLPIFSILLTRFGLWACLLAGGIGTIMVAVPFALPQVSFLNYSTLLSLSKNQVSGFSRAFSLALIFIIYTAPAIVTLGLYRDPKKESLGIRKWHLLSLIIGGMIISWAASRPGAGYWHFMPFFPVIFVFSSDFIRNTGLFEDHNVSSVFQQRVVLSVFLALLLGVTPVLASKSLQSVTEMRAFRKDTILFDLKLVQGRYPEKTIGILPGGVEFYHRTFFRPFFVWQGNPYIIDPSALMELKFLGVELESKIINIIDQCLYQVALIPKGARPLEMISWYGGELLLSSSISDRFLKKYEKETGTQYFDVYFCKN